MLDRGGNIGAFGFAWNRDASLTKSNLSATFRRFRAGASSDVDSLQM